MNYLKHLEKPYLVLIAILAILITKWIFTKVKSSWINCKLKKIGQKVKERRNQKIADFQIEASVPTETKEMILNSDATGLVKLLNEGKITSVQILVTYIERIATIAKDHHLIADINFAEAMQKARECDLLRKTNPNACKSALFGLPISIKDCFDQKGLDSTCGIISKCNKPVENDSFAIELLKENGAIPFVRSNLPQAGMSMESCSFWGRAENPWDRTRAVGGSSGGEGGLIASRCSSLGIGSDIGGSIRIPALFCGIYGFKPSQDRIGCKGHTSYAPTFVGQINYKVAIGPLGRSVNDMNLMMKALLNEESWAKRGPASRNPYICYKPWNENLVYQSPKPDSIIGYVTTCEFFDTCKSNRRAVNEAVNILMKKGYKLVNLDIPMNKLIEESMALFCSFTFAEGNARFLHEMLCGEEPIKEYDTLVAVSSLPNWAIKVVGKILSLCGLYRLSRAAETFLKLDAHEYLKLSYRQLVFQDNVMKIWEDYKLDALILPGLAAPAIKHTTSKDIFSMVAYTAFCNLANISAGAMPITKVQQNEQDYTKEDTVYWDPLAKKLKESMKNSEGLPVGIQVCTLPFEEEKCLAFMREIDNEVRFYEKFKFPK